MFWNKKYSWKSCWITAFIPLFIGITLSGNAQTNKEYFEGPAFAQAGGTVYLLGNLPTVSVENRWRDPQMIQLMKKLKKIPSVHKVKNGIQGLVKEGAPFMKTQALFNSNEFEILTLHRRIDGKDSYWLANNTGERVGARLWPPFEFYIQEHLRSGKNSLKIRVGNLLLNAMGQFIDQPEFNWLGEYKVSKDYNAGLLGPVNLQKPEQNR